MGHALKIANLVAAFLLVSPVAHAADGGLACPSTVPADGSSCSAPAACEYGADAHGLCSTFASCVSGSWHVVAPSSACDANASDCPSAFETIPSGFACPLAAHDAKCIYDEGICACPSMCLGANSTQEWQWLCHAWADVQAGCPETRPTAGTTPCSQEGQFCSWDGCCGGMPLGADEKCTGGVWTLDPVNDCACGGQEQACAFPPIALDAGADATSDATTTGAEPDEPVVGCTCTVTTTQTSKPDHLALSLALTVLFVAARRRLRKGSSVSTRRSRRSCRTTRRGAGTPRRARRPFART